MVQTIALDNAVTALLDSIDEDRLVILCGAGLSMAPPSNLPSAAALANEIFDHCQRNGEIVQNDLEEQANHFLESGRFCNYFIRKLIPTDSFAMPHNLGHSAIADFLLCRAATSVISTNLDNLIETAAHDLFGEVDGLLDGQEAENAPHDRSPLLKIHGCWIKDRDNTVWAPAQIQNEPVKSRIARSAQWLNLHLANKDLLIIGFWSDWSYLNTVLESSLGAIQPSRVIIIDPSDVETLREKAPGLHELGSKDDVTFLHLPLSGSEFLNTLRLKFSRKYVRSSIYSARQSYLDSTGNEPHEVWYELPEETSLQALYAIRRDIEGCSPSEPAKAKNPNINDFVGLTILQLQAKGAVFSDGHWLLDDRKIRVLNAPWFLHIVRQKFQREVTPFGSADIVICVGAEDTGLPGNIARDGRNPSIVRGGPSGEWITRPRAQELLNL
ncbi:MAG: SIR2 family protein [Pseudomonadales bacterium]|nr:SIR2 family protein [Pseudomonadales bacterium]